MSKRKIKSPVHNAPLVLVINSRPDSNRVLLLYSTIANVLLYLSTKPTTKTRRHNEDLYVTLGVVC